MRSAPGFQQSKRPPGSIRKMAYSRASATNKANRSSSSWGVSVFATGSVIFRPFRASGDPVLDTPSGSGCLAVAADGGEQVRGVGGLVEDVVGPHHPHGGSVDPGG